MTAMREFALTQPSAAPADSVVLSPLSNPRRHAAQILFFEDPDWRAERVRLYPGWTVDHRVIIDFIYLISRIDSLDLSPATPYLR